MGLFHLERWVIGWYAQTGTALFLVFNKTSEPFSVISELANFTKALSNKSLQQFLKRNSG
jgi:hypothetical protein